MKKAASINYLMTALNLQTERKAIFEFMEDFIDELLLKLDEDSDFDVAKSLRSMGLVLSNLIAEIEESIANLRTQITGTSAPDLYLITLNALAAGDRFSNLDDDLVEELEEDPDDDDDGKEEDTDDD